MAVTDRWPELREIVRDDDGLPTLPIPAHSRDKLVFLHRYIDITTTAMVGKPHWPDGVAFLDLFCGPGVGETISGDRYPGSPLIAALSKKPMSAVVCCDKDVAHAKACSHRLKRFAPQIKSKVFHGSSAETLQDMIKEIPDRALTITLIDPFNFGLQFDLFSRIAEYRRADFIVLFADSMDLSRNLPLYSKQGGRIDEFLGDSEWREGFAALDTHAEEVVCTYIRNCLVDRLKSRLGYQAFETKGIGPEHRRYYTLLFASKHPMGAKFWLSACKKDAGGQSGLFG